MSKLSEAMKKAKSTGKPQKVTESEKIDSVKVNISIRLDNEVLKDIKKLAEAQGIPYQTLINSILTKATKAPNLEDRIIALEKAILGAS